MKIYAVVSEMYFDTFAGDQFVEVPYAYFTTRELAEAYLGKEFNGYGKVVEIEVKGD